MLINRTLRRNFAGAAGGLQFKFPASFFFQDHIIIQTGHHERSGNGLKRKEMSHTTNRTPGGESRLPTKHTRARNLDVCVNILVEEVDGSSVLEQIRRVVDPSRYIIYPIKSSELGNIIYCFCSFPRDDHLNSQPPHQNFRQNKKGVEFFKDF